jgi:hypothetical protein
MGLTELLPSRAHHEDKVDRFKVKPDARFACGLHPRNWCDSLETATRCSAYDQCLKATWATQKNTLKKLTSALSERDGIKQKSCAFCMHIVEKLQELFTEKKEANVKNYLTSSCAILPSKEMSDLCISAVNQYFEQINEMAQKNLVTIFLSQI